MSEEKSNATILCTRTRGGALVRLSGVIDESFVADELIAGSHGVMVIDLNDIRQITSFGIREWIGALRNLHADYYCFINCPPTIVSQLNMVAGFAGQGQVVSFHAPYLCDSCETESHVVLDLRQSEHRDAVAQLMPPPHTCPSCGEACEFDDLPDLYFQYFRAAPLPNPPALANAIIDGRETGQAFRIEKQIADVVTGVWMSGSMNRAAYFKRLADGMQGSIVVVGQEVDSVTDKGLAGFIKFLRKPALKIYLARLSPILVTQLAQTTTDIGASTLISVTVPCPCSHCGRPVPIELDRAAMQALEQGEPVDEHCPECATRVPAPSPGDWLEAACSLPGATPPIAVREYLDERPRYPTEEPVSGVSEPPEKLLGRYQIQRLLGTGGMGDVFLARRLGPAGFKKLVVIKRIRTDRLDDETVLEHFLQEARLSARLSHPNIVQIFDLGKVGTEYFLTMEYIDGPDLRSVIGASRKLGIEIPIPICCRITSDLCQALHAAHTYQDETGRMRPIIHRDVSPGNVLISSDGVVKLTDFGIAKAADSLVETEPGMIKGTMRYIPPEALRRPKLKMVLPRMDVYAAGVLFYESLTGEPLFQGSSWVNTLQAILRQPLPNLAEMRPGVTSRLVATFERSVARDPEQRYQQMWDFYRDLESTIEELGQPVSNRQLADWIHDLMEQKKLLDPESDTSLDASGNRKKTITNLTKPEKNLNEGSNSG